MDETQIQTQETEEQPAKVRVLSPICCHKGCKLPKHKSSSYCREHKNQKQREWQQKKEETADIDVKSVRRLKKRNPNLYKALVEGEI